MRLADYLGMDIKTLHRILDEDATFSQDIKAADAEFLGVTIRIAQKKRPEFILETKYRDEFKKINTLEILDPEKEIKRVMDLIKSNGTSENIEGTNQPSEDDSKDVLQDA